MSLFLVGLVSLICVIVALPTNRVAWVDGYFVGGDWRPELQQYSTQDRVFSCEHFGFDVSSCDDFLYRSVDEG